MLQNLPEISWLIVLVAGALTLGAFIAWGTVRYRTWRERQARSGARPTD
jgi:hypothetical protein